MASVRVRETRSIEGVCFLISMSTVLLQSVITVTATRGREMQFEKTAAPQCVQQRVKVKSHALKFLFKATLCH